MDHATALRLAGQLLAGELTPEAFSAAAAGASTARVDEQALSLDTDRRARCGFPEVIYGPGKSVEAIAAAVGQLASRGERVLATRVAADAADAVRQTHPALAYNPIARTLRLDPEGAPLAARGEVAVVSAGTTDRPVAEEARETLEWMGVRVTMVHDVGVAGPHRLPARLAEFQLADAVVVVAGMEGALPSVVGGYVACPVIGAPTSVGYGANFGGVSALLSMLNSCASNVTVVNIDSGFKAGYVAGLIATRAADARSQSSSANGGGGD